MSYAIIDHRNYFSLGSIFRLFIRIIILIFVEQLALHDAPDGFFIVLTQ